LPAPLRERAIRLKIRDALFAARGQTLETDAAIDAFIDSRLPFSVRGTFGGNTSCVEIIPGDEEYVICDLGTGVRDFGNHVIAEHDPAAKRCFNVFLSHLHWDHIMELPFFWPAYIPGNLIRIHSSHAAVREALHKQQSHPCFPVDFRALQATIEFVALEPGQIYEIAGLSVTIFQQFHAVDSYGYRFARGDKTIVYSTDCEHKYSKLD
jgi:phosphoribosyl 1,2-cyclic phosphodiesterase